MKAGKTIRLQIDAGSARVVLDALRALHGQAMSSARLLQRSRLDPEDAFAYSDRIEGVMRDVALQIGEAVRR